MKDIVQIKVNLLLDINLVDSKQFMADTIAALLEQVFKDNSHIGKIVVMGVHIKDD